MKKSFVFGLWLMAVLLSTESVFSAWSTDPTVNTPVCAAAGEQRNPQIISDGSGGAIITWWDSREGWSAWDIYAQRMDSSGIAIWITDGAPVCTANGYQESARITSDGSGGGIITWWDKRGVTDYDIYIQRIDQLGNALWTTDGVPVCTANNYQRYPQLISVSPGGAILTWEDNRPASSTDIYAQYIDSLGNVKWTTDGVAVCIAPNIQSFPQLIPDGSGGAIITWEDLRSGTDYDIYIQRIDQLGNALWTTDGVPVCTANESQWGPQLIPDGSGGAIITWFDYRPGSTSDIFAQHIDSLGNAIWATDGVVVCTADGRQFYPQLISDGSGGAIITWWDRRSGTYADIYVQHIDSSGNAKWVANGVPVCMAIGDQEYPQLIPDGSGGAIITWWDRRSGTYADIYAQRLDSLGNALWTIDGVAVCTALDQQKWPQLISDGLGGAIITWYDSRNGTDNYDIYAQRVNPDGTLGPPTLQVPSLSHYGLAGLTILLIILSARIMSKRGRSHDFPD